MVTSAVRQIDAAFERIRRVDPALRAMLSTLDEPARRRAAELDAHSNGAGPRGALFGQAFVAKDNICADVGTTTCGSKMLENFRSPYNAHVIERLQAAGAVLVGKANLDEFAMGSSTENSGFFPTRNPWDRFEAPHTHGRHSSDEWSPRWPDPRCP